MKLSIVIPIHNQGAFLFAACESLLRERADTEVIVVDDGSTEELWDLLGELNVKYFRLGRRQGVAAARNYGGRQASGEYLGFLDADDKSAAGGLTWRVDYLDAHPEFRAVAGALGQIIGEDGLPLPSFTFPWAATPLPPLLTREWARARGPMQTAAWSLTFRRDFFLELGGFDESLRFDPDTDLLTRALEQTSIPYFAKAVVDYRVHAGNHSRLGGIPEFRQKPHVLAETWLSYLAAQARQ